MLGLGLESYLQPAGTWHEQSCSGQQGLYLAPWWQRDCHIAPVLCTVV